MGMPIGVIREYVNAPEMGEKDYSILISRRVV
jgi:hypothetical protein